MARKLRNTNVSAWLIPLLYAAGALVLGIALPRLTGSLATYFNSSISVSAAIGIYSSVASGMIALTGIVFSLTFLTVQFSATAYSPRLVPWIARDPVMAHAFGVFTATFMYALTASPRNAPRPAAVYPGQCHHVHQSHSARGNASGESHVDFHWR
jgi:uncharacterized membrane protein